MHRNLFSDSLMPGRQAIDISLSQLPEEQHSSFKQWLLNFHATELGCREPKYYAQIVSAYDSPFGLYNYLNLPYIMEKNPHAWQFYTEQYPLQAFLALYLDLFNYSSRLERTCYQQAIIQYQHSIQEHHPQYTILSTMISAYQRNQSSEFSQRMIARYTNWETPFTQLMSIALLSIGQNTDDNYQIHRDISSHYEGSATYEELFIFLHTTPYLSVTAYQPIFEQFPALHSFLLLHGHYDEETETYDIIEHLHEVAQSTLVITETSLWL